MSSLTKDRNAWVIRVSGIGESRKKIRIGDVPKRVAEQINLNINAMEQAIKLGLGPPEQVLEWVRNLPDAFYAKLVKAGLCQGRICIHLEKFLDAFYEERRKGREESTVRSWSATRNNLIEYFGQSADIRKIDKDQASEFIDELDSRYAAGTLKKRLSNAKMFFSYAVKENLIRKNPFDGIQAGSYQNDERQYFVEPDLMMDVIASSSPQYQIIFRLARFAGFRMISESQGLLSANVFRDEGYMKVWAPKTKSWRNVPLFPELKSDEWDLSQEHVIPNHPTAPVTRRYLESQLEKKGIPAWPKLFQNLRSSRETELIDSGEFTPESIHKWFGHSGRVSFKHYYNADSETKRAASVDLRIFAA